MNKDLQAFFDEQLAAGKTIEEIEEALWDSPEADKVRHDKRLEKEDRESLERGY